MISTAEQKIFERSIALIGEESFERLNGATVLIVGLGGVGAAAAEAVARLGISRIILCDFDTVEISNINRQILAFHSCIGEKKVSLMERRIRDIYPACDLVCLDLKLSKENIDVLEKYEIDYIIDAIDSFDDKVSLICYAKERKIPIISSMGTGGKINPLDFKVADYKETKYCRLAKKLRKVLKELGIKELKVVYSEEVAKNDFSKHSFVSSISFVPPVAGYIMASELYKDLSRRVDKEENLEH